jgi:hypothetical protein
MRLEGPAGIVGGNAILRAECPNADRLCGLSNLNNGLTSDESSQSMPNTYDGVVRTRSPQTLSEADRRLVAAWAADCAERVLALFEAEAPEDDRPHARIARTRAFARGELDTAGEIRRRFAVESGQVK